MELENVFSECLGNNLGSDGMAERNKRLYLVNLSTTTKMMSLLSDIGRPSMKSILMCVQANSGTCNG
jgi:hypothetical protein